MAFRYGTGIETGASSVRSRPIIMALEQRWSFGGSGVDRDGALWRWIEDKAGACGDRVTTNRYMDRDEDGDGAFEYSVWIWRLGVEIV